MSSLKFFPPARIIYFKSNNTLCVSFIYKDKQIDTFSEICVYMVYYYTSDDLQG